jgi:hypothetical protein
LVGVAAEVIGSHSTGTLAALSSGFGVAKSFRFVAEVEGLDVIPYQGIAFTFLKD